MTTDHDEPAELSPTAEVLHELQLYAFRPYEDEPDHRPLPEGRLVTGAMADIFDALVTSLQDTRLEPDLENLLWGQVNLFHRTCERVERKLDENEQAQKRSREEYDGSEVNTVELEDLTRQGLTLIERRNAFELMRDTAKRNDAMLDVLPIGVVVFPGTGIQDNLADKARARHPLFDFRKGGA